MVVRAALQAPELQFCVESPSSMPKTRQGPRLAVERLHRGERGARQGSESLSVKMKKVAM